MHFGRRNAAIVPATQPFRIHNYVIDFILRPIRRRFGKDRMFYAAIDDMFGFIPHNIELYKLALIHKSASVTLDDGRQINNERLEFLGDAVIESVTSDYLFIEFPDQDEGFLTQLRSKMVSRQSLNEVAKRLKLDTHVITHSSASFSQKHIYGDAFEAMMGAIYLDQGYDFVNRLIINRIFGDYLRTGALLEEETDFKSRLIEWCQKNHHFIRFITTHDKNYSSAHPVFYCKVLIDDIEAGYGSGDSKKEAEQHAAYSVSQGFREEDCAKLFDRLDAIEKNLAPSDSRHTRQSVTETADEGDSIKASDSGTESDTDPDKPAKRSRPGRSARRARRRAMEAAESAETAGATNDGEGNDAIDGAAAEHTDSRAVNTEDSAATNVSEAAAVPAADNEDTTTAADGPIADMQATGEKRETDNTVQAEETATAPESETGSIAEGNTDTDDIPTAGTAAAAADDADLAEAEETAAPRRRSRRRSQKRAAEKSETVENADSNAVMESNADMKPAETESAAEGAEAAGIGHETAQESAPETAATTRRSRRRPSKRESVASDEGITATEPNADMAPSETKSAAEDTEAAGIGDETAQESTPEAAAATRRSRRRPAKRVSEEKASSGIEHETAPEQAHETAEPKRRPRRRPAKRTAGNTDLEAAEKISAETVTSAGNRENMDTTAMTDAETPDRAANE